MWFSEGTCVSMGSAEGPGPWLGLLREVWAAVTTGAGLEGQRSQPSALSEHLGSVTLLEPEVHVEHRTPLEETHAWTWRVAPWSPHRTSPLCHQHFSASCFRLASGHL